VSEAESSTALEKPKALEAYDIERRRELVAKMRFALGLTEHEISRRLQIIGAREKRPELQVGITTVNRDLMYIRKQIRREYIGERFDPIEVIHEKIQGYRRIFRLAMRKAAREKDTGRSSAAWRTALQAYQQETDLLQDVGLIDRRIGTLFIVPADGKKVERIPTGDELQKHFDAINVTEGEIISEAERAWMYGDAAASDAAAKDTGAGED
jgi:hypothetical protein